MPTWHYEKLFFLKIKAGALPIHLRGSKLFKDTEILQKNLYDSKLIVKN